MRTPLKTLFFLLTAAAILPLLAQLRVTFFSMPLDSPDGNSFGEFGISVSSAGDVNNDGFDDVIVGAPGEIPGTGNAYIFSIYDSTVLHTLTGPLSTDEFGISVAGIGDVNNDGHDDVLVGTDWGGSPGLALVFSGATGDTLYSLTSPFGQIGGAFGRIVSSAGDANNDGIQDLLIGAPEEFPAGVNRGGRAYIFDGENGDTLHTLVSPNNVSGGYFGDAIAAIGDINNDGHDDVLIGAPGEIYNQQRYGRAYAFSGATGDTLFVFESLNPQSSGWFGYAVAGAGDVNNDSIPDVIIGSQESANAMSSSGRVYVFSGADGSHIYTIQSPNVTSFGYFGVSVSGYTDINNDNHDDFIIGAYHEESFEELFLAGRIYIYSGATGDTLCTLESPTPEESGKFGFSVAPAGDVNNDGSEDIIVGAFGENGGSPNGEGKAHVLSTNPFIISAIENAQEIAPSEFVLEQNYPNPFNPSTTIRYSLPKRAFVSLAVYNSLGQEVRRLVHTEKNAGVQQVDWDGHDNSAQQVASGAYYYRLTVENNFTETKKLLLLK